MANRKVIVKAIINSNFNAATGGSLPIPVLDKMAEEIDHLYVLEKELIRNAKED